MSAFIYRVAAGSRADHGRRNVQRLALIMMTALFDAMSRWGESIELRHPLITSSLLPNFHAVLPTGERTNT